MMSKVHDILNDMLFEQLEKALKKGCTQQMVYGGHGSGGYIE